jgi:hypothetical protein
MKIKSYLKAIEKLPQTLSSSHNISISVSNDIEMLELDSQRDRFSYEMISFTQVPYKKSNGKLEYKWVRDSKIDIDYRINDIYMLLDDVTFFNFLGLVKSYNFNLNNFDYYSHMNMVIYINFKSKSAYFLNAKKIREEYFYINDEEILENIFFANINEYPNGVPIIWED